MTISEAIRFGTEKLADAGVPEFAKESVSLLLFVIARDRAFIIAHPEYELTASESELFANSISRRASREPYQHITGRQEFYGLDFIVTPDVLIPRPETELIVERAIELLADLPSPRFIEIGIGSGCISVAILKHSPKASGLAVDISEAAIDVARRNAEMHRVSDRLTITRSDVFESIPTETFDLIVSNPPYVPMTEYNELQPEVRDHDPRAAVTDGSTGITIIGRIATDAPMFLRPGGHLLVEIGCGQRDAVNQLFDRTRWDPIEFINDLQGIPRTLDTKLL